MSGQTATAVWKPDEIENFLSFRTAGILECEAKLEMEPLRKICACKGNRTCSDIFRPSSGNEGLSSCLTSPNDP